MYITLQTDYAIRIVDYLAFNAELKCAKEISETTSVPLRFAKNILQQLVGRGLIISFKGAYGGYKLARSPEKISLYDVFQAVDEPTILNRCLYEGYKCSCSEEKQCRYYDVFMRISREMEKSLHEARFSQDSRIKFRQAV